MLEVSIEIEEEIFYSTEEEEVQLQDLGSNFNSNKSIRRL